MNKKHFIGRSDVASFPALKLIDIAIKIDSGAYTSSIHCHEIQTIEQDGKEVLQFQLLDPEHPNYHDKQFSFEEFELKTIKNSFGETEIRYVIQTEIELFNQLYPIQLSLTNRGNMKFPVLIGRKLLENFYIDVTKKDLSFQHKQAANENCSFI